MVFPVQLFANLLGLGAAFDQVLRSSATNMS
jgi:hypothetical protein